MMEIRVADCPLGAKCEEAKTDAAGVQYIARCPWYIEVTGYDANKGAETSNWGCAIAWMPALMINTANEARQGAAATESFRNEMMKQGSLTQTILAAIPGVDHRNKHNVEFFVEKGNQA